jgi:hypothetical protein
MHMAAPEGRGKHGLPGLATDPGAWKAISRQIGVGTQATRRPGIDESRHPFLSRRVV